jgi:hypothetical protein
LRGGGSISAALLIQNVIEEHGSNSNTKPRRVVRIAASLRKNTLSLPSVVSQKQKGLAFCQPMIKGQNAIASQ